MRSDRPLANYGSDRAASLQENRSYTSTSAIATVSYTPAASSLVADLAPESLRGVYLSINSLCWAVGYLIGPPIGGFALDQPRPLADSFWLALALSVGFALLILQYLNRLLSK